MSHGPLLEDSLNLDSSGTIELGRTVVAQDDAPPHRPDAPLEFAGGRARPASYVRELMRDPFDAREPMG